MAISDNSWNRWFAGLFEGARQIARFNLARLHVGLVERIDANDGAGDRGRDFETNEFLDDMREGTLRDANDGMIRRFEFLQFGLVLGIIFALEREIDKEPIVAIDFGPAQRLAVDWDQAFAMFAGGFREELLGPGAEAGKRGRSQHCDLVAAAGRRDAERNAKRHRRVFVRRHVGAARADHGP
jgi:hypothetical protein